MAPGRMAGPALAPPAAPQRIGNSLRLRIQTGLEPPWVPHRAPWAWPGPPGPAGLPPGAPKGPLWGALLLRLALGPPSIAGGKNGKWCAPLNRGDQKWEIPICAEDHQRILGGAGVGRDAGRT
jgi:hypothetical protein